VVFSGDGNGTIIVWDRPSGESGALDTLRRGWMKRFAFDLILCTWPSDGASNRIAFSVLIYFVS